MENKDKEDRNAYRAEQVGGDGMQVYGGYYSYENT